MRTIFWLVIIITLATATIVEATAVITTGWAVVVHEREQTKQVEIAEVQATARTQIVSDASVEVARINADATKKTSFAFSFFYLVRYLAWLSGIAVVLWVAVWVKETVRA